MCGKNPRKHPDVSDGHGWSDLDFIRTPTGMYRAFILRDTNIILAGCFVYRFVFSLRLLKSTSIFCKWMVQPPVGRNSIMIWEALVPNFSDFAVYFLKSICCTLFGTFFFHKKAYTFTPTKNGVWVDSTHRFWKICSGTFRLGIVSRHVEGRFGGWKDADTNISCIVWYPFNKTRMS